MGRGWYGWGQGGKGDLAFMIYPLYLQNLYYGLAYPSKKIKGKNIKFCAPQTPQLCHWVPARLRERLKARKEGRFQDVYYDEYFLVIKKEIE